MSSNKEIVEATITRIKPVPRESVRSFDYSVHVAVTKGAGQRALVAETMIGGVDTSTVLRIGQTYRLELEHRAVSETSLISNSFIVGAIPRQ